MTKITTEKNREYRERSRARLTDDERRSRDRKHTYKWREANIEQWRDYQKEYWQEYRNDPRNSFAHHCRNSLLSRQKGTWMEQKKKENNLTNQHIIDLRVLYDFFSAKGFFVEYDYGFKSLLTSICNRPENLRLIKRTKNTRATVEPQKRIRRAAERLEKASPVVCGGLVAYLESIEYLQKESNDE